MKLLQHISAVGRAIPFGRKGLHASEMLSYVIYMGEQDVVGAHPGFANVGTNVTRFFLSTKSFMKRVSEAGRKLMTQLEQKRVLFKKAVVGTFSTPAHLVLVPLAGTLSRVKGCLMLDKDKRFVAWDKEGSCLQTPMPSLVEVSASQLLNDKSNLTRDVKLKDSARVYRAAMKNRLLRESLENWSAPPGLTCMRTFQELVALHLCALPRDYSMFDLAHELSITGWENVWRGRVESLEGAGMHAQSCGTMGVEAIKVTIEQYMAVTGCFC